MGELYNQETYELIEKLMLREGTGMSGVIRDILSDVIHICYKYGFDPSERFEEAVQVAEWEISNEMFDANPAAKAKEDLS